MSNNIYSNSSLTHLKSGQVNQISIITHPAGYISNLCHYHSYFTQVKNKPDSQAS